MVSISDLKPNGKYYITIFIPYHGYYMYNLCVRIVDVIPRKRPDLPDYITIATLPSSRDFITECGLNPLTMPLEWIKKVETIHDVLGSIMIDDMIHLIDEYV